MLKASEQENDQIKLLEKIRELLDVLEGGKKAGLLPANKKASGSEDVIEHGGILNENISKGKLLIKVN